MVTLVCELRNGFDVFEMRPRTIESDDDEYSAYALTVEKDRVYLGAFPTFKSYGAYKFDDACERAHNHDGLMSVRLNGVCYWSWEAVLAKRAAAEKAKEKAEKEAQKEDEKAEKTEKK